LNIRTRMRALILATLLPVAIAGIAGAYVLVEKERETLERGVRDRVLALMTAIEAEMQASIASLEVLARSPSLQKNDFAGFRAEAERAVAARKGNWANIVLTDARSHEMLVNLLLSRDAALPQTWEPESVVEAVRFRRGAIGNVTIGTVLKRPVFAIHVPVFRGDTARYTIAAVVDVRTIARIADHQRIPESWTIAVLDGNYRFVVRRPTPAQGSEYASESLRTALSRAEQGWERGKLMDGTEIYRAFYRSSISRWATSIAVPRAVVDEGLRGLWLLVAAFVGAGVLALWIAWWLASRISRPIAALAAAAPSVGRGDASAIPPPGPMDEIRQLSHALTEAAVTIREREERQRLAEQALLAADRAKDEFLAMLGHELRNPLSSVSNAAQLLKLARHDPAVLENVSAILGRQVEHMTRLVDDLLEVGRVTGGKVHLERTPVDLAQVVGDLIDTWKSGGRFLHHEVRTSLQSAWALADRARAEQIVSNLLDNALKFTSAGGRIELAVRPDGDNATLEISDNGEGMSPELIGRVFDLFVQGERGLARERGGLGIGLTMVKRLVELHDGTIRAASDGPGKGTRFIVTFPAVVEPLSVPATTAVSTAARSTSRHVLIIEDNHDARESLAALLRMSGHDVKVSETGTKGLTLAAAHPFDLVVIDVGLPDIDGYEIARRLRRAPATRSLRLVALTGYGAQNDRRRALAAGFDEHLAKPVNLEKLEALMNSPVEKRIGFHLS
jgi:signal transduction histidine kinase/ActR/RegA family two-component response regulator